MCSVLVLLLVACGGDETMGPAIDAFETELAALTAMHGAHEKTIDGASALGPMRTEEDGYGTSSKQHDSGLRLHAGHMGMCRHGSVAPDTAGLENGLNRARAEIDRHVAAMKAAPDVAAARAEERMHHDAMGARLGELRGAAQSVRGASGPFSCPMHEPSKPASHGGGH